MSKYRNFIFDSYSFDKSSRIATFKYSYDGELNLSESYKFDFEYSEYDESNLDQVLQNLFFVAGVSYYKMYLAPNIKVNAGNIDEKLANFLNTTYQKGLGEFFYVNNLDPSYKIDFPINEIKKLNTLSNTGKGLLIGLGGGKDSLLSLELLSSRPDISTWSIGHKPQLTPLVETIGLPHFWVERNWDMQMLELNNKDALNGHVPISAVFAAAGCVVAVLSGKKDVVVSNENSANEPTLNYREIAINHQYSKSIEFEKNVQDLLHDQFGTTLRYYSLLRPMSELRIAELFSNNGFDKYKTRFCSCNRAFSYGEKAMSWCGECAKCAFVYMILTPFINTDELKEVFRNNLLLDSMLTSTYKKLLGIDEDKPLDCVGEIQESRKAMQLAFEKHPELKNIFNFDISDEYNFRTMYDHLIPDDVYVDIIDKIQ